MIVSIFFRNWDTVRNCFYDALIDCNDLVYFEAMHYARYMLRKRGLDEACTAGTLWWRNSDATDREFIVCINNLLAATEAAVAVGGDPICSVYTAFDACVAEATPAISPFHIDIRGKIHAAVAETLEHYCATGNSLKRLYT